MNSVWVFDSTNIAVTGSHLFQLQGESWQRITLKSETGQQLGTTGLKLFGFSKEDFWVAGGLAFQSLRWEGTTVIGKVHRLDSLEPSALNACWGSSSTDFYIVGNYGTIVHFDGAKWTKFPKVTTKNLASIWGSGPNNVWACGWNQSTGESCLLHFNGWVWSEVDPHLLGDIGPGRHGLIGVWSYDSLGKQFNYGTGSFVYMQSGTDAWKADTLSNKLGTEAYAGLNFIRGNSNIDLFASGSGGYTAHWSGKTWKDYPSLFAFGGNRDIWALDFKGNTVAMAGYRGGVGYVIVGRRK